MGNTDVFFVLSGEAGKVVRTEGPKVVVKVGDKERIVARWEIQRIGKD